MFFYKYVPFIYNGFIASNNNDFILQNLIIPAGLSFYTFQSMSYTIDVYRGHYSPKDKWYEFLLFVSFFPHMVAGPIVRYKDLMPQIKALSFFKAIDWSAFARLTIWGFFKKLVIADNLDKLVSPVFDNVPSYNGLELLIAGFGFVIQVYCDFSGYSDIATGVAKLFNINLSLNWRRPLFSKSLIEFWTRNHISITTWFRDYLYIGLGGNRVAYKRWLLNIFLVFLISGLWHGSNITFAVWGILHAIFYILELMLKKRLPEFNVPNMIGWIYLILFHTISLIAFRAENINDLSHIYNTVFSFNVDWSQLINLARLNDISFYIIIIFVTAILFLKEGQEEFQLVSNNNKSYTFLRDIFYLLIIVLIFTLGDFNANTFIYFQF
ncbi:MAG: MBOAT family protein [Bacteroidia bacterium]